MTSAEADALLAILSATWPTARQNCPETLRAYRMQFQRLNADDALVGVDALVRSCRYWPAIAEVVAATDAAREDRIAAAPRAALSPGRPREPMPREAVDQLKRLFAARIDGRIPSQEFRDLLARLTARRITDSDYTAADRALEAARFRPPAPEALATPLAGALR